jgi:hypothetical protein
MRVSCSKDTRISAEVEDVMEPVSPDQVVLTARRASLFLVSHTATAVTCNQRQVRVINLHFLYAGHTFSLSTGTVGQTAANSTEKPCVLNYEACYNYGITEETESDKRTPKTRMEESTKWIVE